MDQSCHHQLIDNEEVIENLGEKKHCNTEYNTNSSIEANVSTYTTPSTQEYIEYTNQNFAYPVNTQENGEPSLSVRMGKPTSRSPTFRA